MKWRGDVATSGDKCAAVARIDGHDGGISEQAAEMNDIASFFADSGNDAHGGCFVVDHADGGFICDDA